MRILNRVIAASALVVPMGLGVSGVAVADVAVGGSLLPTQSGVSKDEDDGSEHCDDKRSSPLNILNLGGHSDNGECRGDDGEGNDGPLG